MNCPTCGAPLMFGASRCSCGVTASSKRLNEVDLTYLESLRVYWRFYWPSQLTSILAIVMFGGLATHVPDGPLLAGLLALVVSVNALWLVLPRIWNKPYQGFAIAIISPFAGEPVRKLTGFQRLTLLWAILWRQTVGGIVTALASIPINGLLSMMGFLVPQPLYLFVGILAVGPLIMKMIIGTRFSGFTLEVRRGTAGEIALTSPATQP